MADFARQFIGWPGRDTAGLPTTVGVYAIDDANDKVEVIFQAEEDDTITHLGMAFSTNTGTPVQHRVLLKDVDVTTNPAVPGATTHATATFTPPADGSWASTFQWNAIDAAGSYAVTKGQILALVLEPVGTPDGANFINSRTTVGPTSARGMPRMATNAAGVRTILTAQPIYGIKSASREYGLPVPTTVPASSTLFSASVDGTYNNERGIHFNFPTDWFAAFKVGGIRFSGRMAGATGKTLRIALYDSVAGSAALQSTEIDCDVNGAPAVDRLFGLTFTGSPALLRSGVDYRAVIGPKNTTQSCGFARYVVTNANDRRALPGGANFAYVLRTALTDAFTVDTFGRPCMDLIVTDVVSPSPDLLRGLVR